MATLGQLWAWEHEGKTEYGWKHWERTQVSLYVAQDSSVSPIRNISKVTNLRKVKVVDEDAIVLTGITKAELIWFTDGLNTTGSLNHGAFPRQFESIKERISRQLDPTPPITEPKNFGAIVEASHKGTLSLGRIKWVRLRVEGYRDEWWSDKNMGSACWSDLNNPTIISEGVEGWIVMTQ